MLLWSLILIMVDNVLYCPNNAPYKVKKVVGQFRQLVICFVCWNYIHVLWIGK